MSQPICSAFLGTTCIASGDLRTVALKAKSILDTDKLSQLLIFDGATSALIEIDFRGTTADVASRLGETTTAATHIEVTVEAARRAGRPKLGVVAREVTLLPRHWEWLAGQPGGASVALRKLVEQARMANKAKDLQRNAVESVYRFLSAMAGNENGFEEATRALFAGDSQRFFSVIDPWPIDIRSHIRKLADAAFHKPAPEQGTE